MKTEIAIFISFVAVAVVAFFWGRATAYRDGHEDGFLKGVKHGQDPFIDALKQREVRRARDQRRREDPR